MIGESWRTCIPCKLFYVEQGRPGVLTGWKKQMVHAYPFWKLQKWWAVI